MWKDQGRTTHYTSQLNWFLFKDDAINTFRTNKAYVSIIGEPVIPQAIHFLKNAKTDGEIAKNYEAFVKLDGIGSPTKYKLSGQWVSLNTLRYINSIHLLKKEFGSLDGMKIFEIGCGFGGLVHCINTQWKPASYHVLDIEQAMDWCEKVVNKLGHTIVKGTPIDQPDLTIAEYSITEFDEKNLWDYTTSYLFPSKQIFVRCNIFDKDIKEKWIKLLETNFTIKVYNEEPHYVSFNCIVVGTAKH